MRRALVLAGLLVSAPALAYEAPPPHSFAQPTASGKRVLVMLHPLDGPKDKELKKKYSASGLYPADDPTKPVWTCDWLAEREGNAFASDDGVFAVRVPDLDPGLRHWVLSYQKSIPPKKAGWEDGPALFIYRNGKEFRTLALRDVFDASRFTDRDCFLGPVVSIDSFDDATGRVNVSTEAKGTKLAATVDFRTGEVLDQRTDSLPRDSTSGGGGGEGDETAGGRSWGRVILIGLVVVGACAAAFVGLAVLLVRHQRKA